MSLFSIVPCNEVHGSRTEDYSLSESPTCTVQLQCAYTDRYSLVADLLGARRPWPFYIAAFTPLAAQCQIENITTKFAQDGQTCIYDQSIVTVTYNNKITDLFSEELEPTSEFQIVNAKKFVWNNALQVPLQEGEAPGFLRRGLILSKTFFQVPDPLNPALINYVGCCNEDAVTNSMGFFFDKQTLLFVPPQLSRTVTFGGTNAWQVGTKHIYKPSGWNKFWNAEDQQFEQIRVKVQAWGAGPGTTVLYEPYTPVPYGGVFF